MFGYCLLEFELSTFNYVNVIHLIALTVKFMPDLNFFDIDQIQQTLEIAVTEFSEEFYFL